MMDSMLFVFVMRHQSSRDVFTVTNHERVCEGWGGEGQGRGAGMASITIQDIQAVWRTGTK